MAHPQQEQGGDEKGQGTLPIDQGHHCRQKQKDGLNAQDMAKDLENQLYVHCAPPTGTSSR